MNQFSKITPKWGKNRYNLWSCVALEYLDPEKEKIILALSSDPNRVSFRQMRKFNKIACMDCKINGSLEEKKKKQKNSKIWEII